MSYCIALVDPIVSPKYLVAEWRKYPVTLVAVYTLNQMSEETKQARYYPELFDHAIYADNTESVTAISIAEQLKKLGVQYVFSGYEFGVAFCDQLAKLVCPNFANDPQTSSMRYDKYQMQEALKNAGIPCVNQMKVTQQQLTADQMKTLETWHFPVIVKPTKGSGSIGVKACNSLHEIEEFIKGTKHVLLHSVIAEDFVIQECLVGTEYIVDMVNLAGQHRIVNVGRYKKISHGGFPVYRYYEIMDPNSAEWKICADYVLAVAKAVGLNNGFGHIELFLTEQGPRLIEVNPRISGASGYLNKLSEKTLHCNQPQMLYELLTAKACQSPKKLYQYGMFVLLQNWQPRRIGAFNTELVKSLSSYQEHSILKPAGIYLKEPQTLLDTVALVILVNPDQQQLKQDYTQLIEWEKANQLF